MKNYYTPPVRDSRTLEVRRVFIYFVGVLLSLLWLYNYAGLMIGYAPDGDVAIEEGRSIIWNFIGEDFVNFWVAGRLLLSGNVADLSSQAAMHSHARDLLGADFDIGRFYYPPGGALAVAFGALFPYYQALLVFKFTGMLLLMALLSRAIGLRFGVVAVLASPVLLMNLFSGQNGLYFAAIAGAGLWVLRTHPRIAGVLFGLLTIKPHLAFLFVVALLAQKNRPALVWLFATIIVLHGLPVLVWGWPLVTVFLENVVYFANHRVNELVDVSQKWYRLVSVSAALMHIGFSAAQAFWMQAAVSFAVSGAVFWMWQQRYVDCWHKYLVLMAGVFVACPQGWGYDLALLYVAIVWYYIDGLRLGFYSWEKPVLFLTWFIPYWMTTIMPHNDWAITPLFTGLFFVAAFYRALTVRHYYALEAQNQ